jgi:hypothetical protein
MPRRLIRTVPRLPGRHPVRPGLYRGYHGTLASNLDSIVRHGLLQSRSRGEIVKEPSVVWGQTLSPFYARGNDPEGWVNDLVGGSALIEYQFRPEQLLDPSPDYFVRHFAKPERSIVVLHRGNIPPKDILAIHQPWHASYRYMFENKMVPDVVSGEYDYAAEADPEKYGPAIARLKAEAAGHPVIRRL